MASPEVENDYLGDEGLKKLVARVKQADIAIASALDRHASDHDNPHRVTAAQTGADPAGTAQSAVAAHNTDPSAHQGLQTMVSEHVSDHGNPHEVTAYQVGAYTRQETEDRINDALSGEVGGWLGNLTVAEVNALTEHKKGDSATLTDSGVVTPGNVPVNAGDDIMWVDSLSEWQAKISDHLHHDSTMTGSGSTADPLGVDTTVIATKAYVDNKGLEEDNGVLYFR